MAKQYILVNSNKTVGTITIEEARIRGEGGPFRPQLVLPVTVAMSVRPVKSELALTDLRASLRPSVDSFPQDTLGQIVTTGLFEGPIGWSRSDLENEHQMELHLPLSGIDIADIERRRHQDQNGRVHLGLFLQPVVEGIRNFNQQQFGTENLDKGPWDEPAFGMYFQRFTFWTSKIQAIQLTVEMSQWVTSILPALGYNELRLIELRLPPSLPGHDAAVVEFDKARLALDQRRYPECVAACRGLANIWNRLLDSNKSAPMGTVVGDKLGWPTGDPRREFITKTWATTKDIVNVPTHPEGQAEAQDFTVHETTLIFRQVALLSEFLSTVPD